ncbi:MULTISPECIES: molybdenum cofactor cytidylyltransferase [unclassified Romboutsia]|uniref:molybdenum cofactor cytidylyltransferase n=1 Tax=unclassified Romboutsia TaxID=2626894 RepID=UPI000820AE2C|nr:MULTISPECIES: molybdenum cofactor cytidylyltransferase [unclassified Romboutsia]SCI13288.1 molybdopterin-guanine dinucleotide biosynthesis protein MobA [uncultured Clostridium sp.]
MVNAIVMASGLSKRMGENKLLLKYKDIPLVEHILREIKKCDFNEVILVSQYEEILQLGKRYNFKIVKNENSHVGQSESIKLGINNSSDCDGYMFFVGDQPKLKSEHINTIMNTFKHNKDYIIIPKSNNKCGNPVIFPYKIKEELLLLKHDEKGKKVINNNSSILYVNIDEDILFDIDTKSDYDKLRGE